MASLPPVKLDTHEDWFNLLMTVLHQQAEQNPYEEYREMAQMPSLKTPAPNWLPLLPARRNWLRKLNGSKS